MSDKLKVEVKDFDGMQRALEAISSTVNEYGDTAAERIAGIEKDMVVIKGKLDETTKQAMLMADAAEQRQLKARLSGTRIEMNDFAAHPNEGVDEVLRTYNPGGPFNAVQEASDLYYTTLKCLQAVPQGMDASGMRRSCEAAKRQFKAACQRAGFKALDTAETGGGTEWVPTGMSAEYTARFQLALRVASLFDTFEIPRGVGSFDWPATSAGGTAYLISQSTADWTGAKVPTMTSSQMTTYKATFAPKVFGISQHLSVELDEDSAVACLPSINADNVLGLAEGVETAIINGDDSSTHMDYGVSAGDARTAFDGLRHLAKNLATYKAATGVAFDDTLVFSLLKTMGKWAIDPSKMALIPSVSAYWQMVAFGNVKTVANYGGQATLVRGELANFAGVPVVPSPYIYDCSTSGVIDQTTNTKTLLLGVNHRMAKIGLKRGVKLESVYRPEYQQIQLLATTRLSWKPMYNPATAGNTFFGYIYDITT